MVTVVHVHDKEAYKMTDESQSFIFLQCIILFECTFTWYWLTWANDARLLGEELLMLGSVLYKFWHWFHFLIRTVAAQLTHLFREQLSSASIESWKNSWKSQLDDFLSCLIRFSGGPLSHCRPSYARSWSCLMYPYSRRYSPSFRSHFPSFCFVCTWEAPTTSWND